MTSLLASSTAFRSFHLGSAHGYHAGALALVFLAGVSAGVWLPYFSGTLILLLGLLTIWRELLAARPLEKLVLLGPVFFAAPLAVFGAEHFTATATIAGMIPSWIPGKQFWALMVGACLMAAALSIAVRRYAALSASLFALMMVLFELLMHIPNALASHGDRLLWTIVVREFTFCAGALAIASRAESWDIKLRDSVVTAARLLFGVGIAFFGVQYLLHPELAPGVPLRLLTPQWVPAPVFWGYLNGAIFVVAGLCLVANKQVRTASLAVGGVLLAAVICLYLPLDLHNPSDIGVALNYVADTLFLAGSMLSFAATQPSRQESLAAVRVRALRAS